MTKYNENRSQVIYESYEEYIEKQDNRSHNFDCPDCLAKNRFNMKVALSINSNIKSILDLGSRDSAYFDDMIKKGIKCIGIDISKKSVEYARSKNRNVIVGDAKDLNKIFDKDKFDLIMSCHTWEHFLEPDTIINSCKDLLSDNGLILIRLPDEGLEIVDKHHHFAHTRTWTWEQIESLLKAAGFCIVEEKRNLHKEIFIIAKVLQ